MANVSVIIPTYNGSALLRRHLPSVLTALRDGDELIIIDDASQDDTLSYLLNQFGAKHERTEEGVGHLRVEIYRGKVGPKIKVVIRRQNQNLRFARSVNLAVQSAQHALLFLLNNDVSLQKNTIDKLTQRYDQLTDQGQRVFAIGCLEYEGADTQAPKAGKNILYFDKGVFWHRKASNFQAGTTAWTSGGSGLFNKKIWLELGGFDEHYYPAYWEDIDISWRARKKGYLVYFDDRTVVFHQHESTNLATWSNETINQISFSHQKYFTRKNGDFWQKVAYYLWQPYWLLWTINQKMKSK